MAGDLGEDLLRDRATLAQLLDLAVRDRAAVERGDRDLRAGVLEQDVAQRLRRAIGELDPHRQRQAADLAVGETGGLVEVTLRRDVDGGGADRARQHLVGDLVELLGLDHARDLPLRQQVLAVLVHHAHGVRREVRVALERVEDLGVVAQVLLADQQDLLELRRDPGGKPVERLEQMSRRCSATSSTSGCAITSTRVSRVSGSTSSAALASTWGSTRSSALGGAARDLGVLGAGEPHLQPQQLGALERNQPVGGEQLELAVAAVADLIDQGATGKPARVGCGGSLTGRPSRPSASGTAPLRGAASRA